MDKKPTNVEGHDHSHSVNRFAVIPTADRLNGFKGHALALGPIVTYDKKWDGGQVEFAARWLSEFDVKRRIKGDPLMVTATVTF